MQFYAIIRIVGLLIMLFSSAMLIPVIVAIIYQDGADNAFIISFFIGIVTGLLLWFFTRNQKKEFRVKDGFLIVVLFWTVLGSVGALPFLLASELQLSTSEAFFESFSGLTTTGATVITKLAELPKAILFYRQLLQWLGGMGIIVLAVAVLPMLGVGGMQLYRAEIPGPMKENKMTPRIAETAKALWCIYLFLTALCALTYWLAGMGIFDAISHSFSTIAIGGFSTYDNSIGYFDSALINIVCALFLLISGLNFSLHFSAFGRRNINVAAYFNDPELKAFFCIQLALVLICFLVLVYKEVYQSLEMALDQAFFQAVSVSTTAGFTTSSFADWPLFLPVLLIFSSFIGGCAGSTGGGLKVVRAVILGLQGARELKRLIHPRALYKIKLAGHALPDRILEAIWGFFSAYALVFVICMLALIASGMEELSAFSAVVASLNNLGPGLGEVALHYNDISSNAQWVLILAMLFGRLEIFTVLVLFTPAFWKK